MEESRCRSAAKASASQWKVRPEEGGRRLKREEEWREEVGSDSQRDALAFEWSRILTSPIGREKLRHHIAVGRQKKEEHWE